MLEHKIIKLYLNDNRYITDINIQLKPHQITHLKGPNGSGKSTIARSIIGIYNNKSELETYLDQINISKLPIEERIKKSIYYSFQSPISIKGVSLLNILRESYLNSYIEKKLDIISFKKKILELFNTLNLNPELLNRDINDRYSGGEMKKIELIFPLILNSNYIFLDEIDSGLDIHSKKTVYRIINQLKEQGKSILIISHENIQKMISIDQVIDITNIKYMNE